MKYLLLFLTLYTGVYSNNLSTSSIDQLVNINPYKIIKKLGLNIALDFSECASDIKYYLLSITQGKEWALEMLDATAKIQAGILRGNIYNLGNFDECLEADAGSEKRKIDGKYCLGNIPIPLNFALSKKYDIRAEHQLSLKYALCIPKSCTAEKINSILNSVLSTYNVSIKFSNEYCYTQKTYDITTADIVAFFIFGLVGIFMLTGTLYDIYLQRTNQKTNFPNLIAFSLYTNCRQLFKTKTVEKGTDTLNSLVGLRFLSIAWIIYVHTMFVAVLFPVNNYIEAEKYARSLPGQIIMGSSVAVDTFLVMSGTLVAYTLLKQYKNGIKFLDIPVIYLHRYIRLTPAYMAMILFQISLAKYFGSGPLWDATWRDMTNKCTHNWWSSLLYIQNYYNPNSYCLGQSWYLSVDMQLFYLAPFLIIFFRKFKKFIYPTLIFFAVSSTVAVFFISYHYKIMPPIITGSPNMLALRQAKLYVPTHTRAGPWFIGMALGYFLHYRRGQRIRMPPLVVTIGWMVSIVTILSILLGMYPFMQRGYVFNPIADPTYTALHRICWALVIVWIIIACENGYGGIVNSILTFKQFQPLAKLSYCQYIVHYIFQVYIAAVMKESPFYTPFTMIYRFFSDLIITLILAGVLSLSFESPMIIIEKSLFRKEKKAVNDNKSQKHENIMTIHRQEPGYIDHFDITKL